VTTLAHFVIRPETRGRIKRAIDAAEEGTIVNIKEPTRNLEQNALLWALLTCFARQKPLCINGRETEATPEDWKAILTAAFRRETNRVAVGLDGGIVFLGCSTSKMGTREFSDLIEFIKATAAEEGVDISEEIEE
jgi:hypothetical protein